jgi:hypothetical protein
VPQLRRRTLDDDLGTVTKAIVGALKCTIKDHGPITEELVTSAAKRVSGALRGGMNSKQFTSGNCWFCGTPLVSIGNGETRRTIDHLTPRCRGGGIERTNTVESCLACNNEKGRLTLEEYRAVISYRNKKPTVFWGEMPLNGKRSGVPLAQTAHWK